MLKGKLELSGVGDNYKANGEKGRSTSLPISVIHIKSCLVQPERAYQNDTLQNASNISSIRNKCANNCAATF